MEGIGEFFTSYSWVLWAVVGLMAFTMINLKRDYAKRIAFMERMILKNTSYHAAVQKQTFKAAERLMLFLDRCEPAKIATRVKPRTDDVELYIAKLIKVIDEEFAHNITMQLYISPNAWHYVEQARDEYKQKINEQYLKHKAVIESAHQIAPMLYEIKLLGDSNSHKAKRALLQDIQQ